MRSLLFDQLNNVGAAETDFELSPEQIGIERDAPTTVVQRSEVGVHKLLGMLPRRDNSHATLIHRIGARCGVGFIVTTKFGRVSRWS